MGHVEFCWVIERIKGTDNFIKTDDRVVIKVNYVNIMKQRQRHRNQENPLNEIAAMQLWGENGDNVVGIIEALRVEEHYSPPTPFSAAQGPRPGPTINCVMPFYQDGDMQTLIANWHPEGLPEAQVRFWMSEIVRGLLFLQQQGICHRDISPENVVINGDRAFIIDLGSCLRIPYETQNGIVAIQNAPEGARTLRLINQPFHAGKLQYMPPEVFWMDPLNGHAVDAWTCGTTMAFLLTGTPRTYICIA